ncbi:pentapeptide repeat-containing protein [Streptomyces sp. NPDC096033]|uniref:pentapeptide repeat-containing protein n=1 Tax=Streptomyces sp. NPDC096033 TaxID=3366071 RepID=UPI00381F3CBE
MTKGLDRRRAWARRRRRLHRIGFGLVVVSGCLILLVGLPWLVWRGPYLLDAQYINEQKVGDGTGSAQLVTGLRTALVAVAAAIGAGIALVYTIRNYRLTRRGQVTDRFTKSLERLGANERYVRIGGVLALEQIVQDAPEQATHAAQVLGHFVRTRVPARPASPDAPEIGSTPPSRQGQASVSEPTATDAPLPPRPEADVQVALTALTRPESRTHVDIHEALRLNALHLTRADLFGADLTRAILGRADLTRANLGRADLTRANLGGANLTRANLGGANLTRANLAGANLTRAHLAGANLTGAYLEGANFTAAYLDGTDLTRAINLSPDQINAAVITKWTKLPPGIEAAIRPGTDKGPASDSDL